MAEENGHTPRRPGPPPGAVVLTREIFERTSRKWVQLPMLSRKVARMSVTELLADGYLEPIERWADGDRARLTRELVREAAAERYAKDAPDREADPDGYARWEAGREAYLAEAEQSMAVPADDAALLEARAGEVRSQGVWVEIGMVGSGDVVALQPHIPGSETWPRDTPEAFMAAYNAWFEAQPPEVHERIVRQMEEAQYRIIAIGLLTPAFTPELVKRLRDDAFLLMLEINRLSGRPVPGVLATTG